MVAAWGALLEGKRQSANRAELAAFIEEEATARDNHDAEITRLEQEIAASEQAQQIATSKRAAENGVYNKNSDDMKGALDALVGAIGSLKSSKSPSLAQLNSVRQTVHTAVVLADALGFSMDGMPTSFLQAG